MEYIEFSKAFDSMNHTSLHEQLNIFCVGMCPLAWLEGILTRLRQRASIGSSLLCWVTVSSDVLQRQEGGPLLFSIFPNELPFVFRSKCLLLVDDLNLWSEIYSPKDTQLSQQELDALFAGSVDNALSINFISIGKAATLANYTIGGTPFPVAVTVKNVVAIDQDDLSTSKRMKVVATGTRKLWMLWR